MSAYDETNKLWRSFDREQSNDAVKLTGQQILGEISSHGSKVAQVIIINIYSTFLSIFKIELIFIRRLMTKLESN